MDCLPTCIFGVNEMEKEWPTHLFHNVFSSTFQTNFVQLTKPSQVFVRPTGIQALPSPVNSTIIMMNLFEYL